MRLIISDIKLLSLLLRGIQALKPTLRSFSLKITECQYMKDLELRAIFLYLGKLTQLEALSLTLKNSKNFSEQELFNLAAAFSKLGSLRKVALDPGNCCVFSVIPTFFAALQKLQNLSDLALNFSNYDPLQETNTTTESVVAGLVLLKNHPIQKLTLTLSTLFKSSEDLSLARILPQFTRLKSLDLYFTNHPNRNAFKDDYFLDVLACLREIPNLSSLTLFSYNPPQLLGVVGNIGRTLKFLPGLAQLKLKFSRFNITDEEMVSLGSGLESLASLKSLDVCLDDIEQTTMKGVNALTGALKKMVGLRNLTLSLRGNKFITNQGVSDLCSSIGCLRNLTFLDLDLGFGLSWTSKDAEELATTLKSLDSLEIFHFTCGEVFKVGNRQEIFQILFEVIQKKQTLQDVILGLGGGAFERPETLYPPETLWWKKGKNFHLF